MLKLNIGEAIGLVIKTCPFIIIRAILYLAFGVCILIYFGIVILLARAFAGGMAAIIFLVATVGIFPIARLFKYFVLYIFKAGHIAVMSQLIAEGKLPDGVNQIEFGKSFVVNKFKAMPILFAVDALIDGILKAFNNTVVSLAEFINLPALEGLAKLINIVINFSVSLIDEAVLSFIIIRKEDNYWEGAKDGIILYVQNWKNILFNSAIMGLINAASFIVFFLILFAPVSLIFPKYSFVALVVAAVFAYLLKQALIYHVAMASMLITFYRETKDKVPDPAWEARLDSISDKFKELKQKAANFVRTDKKPLPTNTT